jgi:hypothetical protein
MVYVSDDTPYLKLLKPFIDKKKVRTGDILVGCVLTKNSDSRPTLGAMTRVRSNISLNRSSNGYSMRSRESESGTQSSRNSRNDP